MSRPLSDVYPRVPVPSFSSTILRASLSSSRYFSRKFSAFTFSALASAIAFHFLAPCERPPADPCEVVSSSFFNLLCGVRVLVICLFLLLFLQVPSDFPRLFRGFSLDSFLYLCSLRSDYHSLLLCKCLPHLQALGRLTHNRLLLQTSKKSSELHEIVPTISRLQACVQASYPSQRARPTSSVSYCVSPPTRGDKAAATSAGQEEVNSSFWLTCRVSPGTTAAP